VCELSAKRVQVLTRTGELVRTLFEREDRSKSSDGSDSSTATATAKAVPKRIYTGSVLASPSGLVCVGDWVIVTDDARDPLKIVTLEHDGTPSYAEADHSSTSSSSDSAPAPAVVPHPHNRSVYMVAQPEKVVGKPRGVVVLASGDGAVGPTPRVAVVDDSRGCVTILEA